MAPRYRVIHFVREHLQTIAPPHQAKSFDDSADRALIYLEWEPPPPRWHIPETGPGFRSMESLWRGSAAQ